MTTKLVRKPKTIRKKPVKVSRRVGTKKFEFLTGDVDWKDYGGKWFRMLDPHVYYVIEFINWEDATGKERHPSGNKYYVQCNVIDLSPGSPWHKQIPNALKSAGWEHEKNIDEVMVLEAVEQYMGGDREYEKLGNNAEKLLADCKRAMS